MQRDFSELRDTYSRLSCSTVLFTDRIRYFSHERSFGSSLYLFYSGNQLKLGCRNFRGTFPWTRWFYVRRRLFFRNLLHAFKGKRTSSYFTFLHCSFCWRTFCRGSWNFNWDSRTSFEGGLSGNCDSGFR